MQLRGDRLCCIRWLQCVCVCLLWGEVWGEVVCASLVEDSVDVYNAICTVAVCKNIIVCMRAS